MRLFAFGRHPVDESDLSAYLDGALPESKRPRVEAHLRSCAGCAQRLDELRQLVATLNALPEAKAPRSFALSPELLGEARRRRESEVARQAKAAKWAYLGLSGATVVAALVLVVALGADLVVSGGGGQGGGPASVPAASSQKSMAAAPKEGPLEENGSLQAEGTPQYEPKAVPGVAGVVPPVTPLATQADNLGETAVPPATPGTATSPGAESSGLLPPPVVTSEPPGTPSGLLPPGGTPAMPLIEGTPPAAGTPFAPPPPVGEPGMPPAEGTPPEVGTPALPLGAAAAGTPSEGMPTPAQEAFAGNGPASSSGGGSAGVPPTTAGTQLTNEGSSHLWLWLLEGIGGGLFVGLGISAFWMRRCWIRTNRHS